MEHNKTTTHDVNNPGAGLGQAHTYDWVKPVKGICSFLPPAWSSNLIGRSILSKAGIVQWNLILYIKHRFNPFFVDSVLFFFFKFSVLFLFFLICVLFIMLPVSLGCSSLVALSAFCVVLCLHLIFPFVMGCVLLNRLLSVWCCVYLWYPRFVLRCVLFNRLLSVWCCVYPWYPWFLMRCVLLNRLLSVWCCVYLWYPRFLMRCVLLNRFLSVWCCVYPWYPGS